MATLAQAQGLADTLAMELSRRTGKVRVHNDYYRGKHPLRYASEEFSNYFAKQYAGFADNWVQPVADAPVERLTVVGVRAAGEVGADTDLWEVWQRNGLDADSQLGFLGAVTSARCYVLVWGDPDDEDTPCVTFEDASSAIVLYEPGSRRRRRAALKLWQDGSREYATLYLPSEVWKFARPLSNLIRKPVLVADADDQVREWEPRDTGDEPNPQPNPIGVVPMVELPNRPLLVEQPISDVSGVIAMQDAINLLWSHLLVASDFASLAQRVITGAQVPKIPILDANGQKIGERPVDLKRFMKDRVLWLEDPNAKIASWTPADLSAYTDTIEVAVGHIAAQTRTPQHYLIGKIANLSGDALIAAEAGLVKKCQEKQLWFGQGLREMFQLIALARGESAKARAIAAGEVLWSDTQSRNLAQLSDSLLKLKQIGFPFEWLALRLGLTPTEVVDLLEMRERDAELDPVNALMGAATGPPAAVPEPADEPDGDEPTSG